MNADVECVVVVAVLKRSLKFDCLLLVKQYRNSLGADTLEFPVGVVKNNETPGEAGIRKVQEVTGYLGKITKIGDVTAMDAELSNFKVRLVSLEIAINENNNSNVSAEPPEVVKIPISELYSRLENYRRDGVIVDSRVEMYACGLNTSKRLMSQTSPAI